MRLKKWRVLRLDFQPQRTKSLETSTGLVLRLRSGYTHIGPNEFALVPLSLPAIGSHFIPRIRRSRASGAPYRFRFIATCRNRIADNPRRYQFSQSRRYQSLLQFCSWSNPIHRVHRRRPPKDYGSCPCRRHYRSADRGECLRPITNLLEFSSSSGHHPIRKIGCCH